MTRRTDTRFHVNGLNLAEVSVQPARAGREPTMSEMPSAAVHKPTAVEDAFSATFDKNTPHKYLA